MPLVNTLSASKSPYLQSHKDNPVAWQQWNEASLKRAVNENKPIFLSIGYHTCHWCHVMNEESFSSDLIASILNEHFIPIKVDREERPDVDGVYMYYLQAMSGGRGGWPLNVFLAPGSLHPIFAGTYWPGPWEEISVKTGRTTKSSGPEFKDVLLRINELWSNEEEKCRIAGSEAVAQLKQYFEAKTTRDATDQNPAATLISKITSLFTDTYEYFLDRFDKSNGGFGNAPKFPSPVILSTLIRQSSRMALEEKINMSERTNEPTPADMAIFTLDKIAQGGIHDLIGRGFSRYSVTADWSLPHFEKMLYDQAMLLNAYLDAWLYDKSNKNAQDCIYDIANYLIAGPLTHASESSIPVGGFYSAEDADSIASDNAFTKREGAFYVWTYEEFFKVLDRIPGDIAASRWNIQEYGNVDPENDIHGELRLQNVPAVNMTIDELSKTFGMTPEKISSILEDCRSKLRKYRETTRMPPSVDNKIVVSWNGLALGALARASSALSSVSPIEAEDWLEVAEATADFIYREMYDTESGVLQRIFLDSQVGETRGMCEDYAFLISGLIDLFEATFDIHYLRWAVKLQNKQNELFWDKENSGFYSVTEDETKRLILRIKSGADAVEPSANSISSSNLYRLSALIGNSKFESLAQNTVSAFTHDLLTQPYSYCGMLQSLVATKEGMSTIVIAVPSNEPEISDLLCLLRSSLLTNTTILVLRTSEASSDDFKWLLQQNSLYQDIADSVSSMDKPAVFICKGRTCSLPITNVEDLKKNIELAS
ncbi:hypothetical protein V1511DRAFT_457736 [Dipodascopsis uninucleata]